MTKRSTPKLSKAELIASTDLHDITTTRIKPSIWKEYTRGETTYTLIEQFTDGTTSTTTGDEASAKARALGIIP